MGDGPPPGTGQAGELGRLVVIVGRGQDDQLGQAAGGLEGVVLVGAAAVGQQDDDPAPGPGRGQLLVRGPQGVGQPGHAVATQAQQPSGHHRGRGVAGQGLDDLDGRGEGQDGVLLRGAQRAGGGDGRGGGQPRAAHRAGPVDHDREGGARPGPVHGGQVVVPDRPGFGTRGRHPVDRGVDVQVAVQGTASGPQPGDPAHRGLPGPGPVQHDLGAEPDRGRPQALVGGGGHEREQLERAGVAGQRPAHGFLVEHPDLGAELGEAGVTSQLVPSDGLALGPSRLWRWPAQPAGRRGGRRAGHSPGLASPPAESGRVARTLTEDLLDDLVGRPPAGFVPPDAAGQGGQGCVQPGLPVVGRYGADVGQLGDQPGVIDGAADRGARAQVGMLAGGPGEGYGLGDQGRLGLLGREPHDLPFLLGVLVADRDPAGPVVQRHRQPRRAHGVVGVHGRDQPEARVREDPPEPRHVDLALGHDGEQHVDRFFRNPVEFLDVQQAAVAHGPDQRAVGEVLRPVALLQDQRRVEGPDQARRGQLGAPLDQDELGVPGLRDLPEHGGLARAGRSLDQDVGAGSERGTGPAPARAGARQPGSASGQSSRSARVGQAATRPLECSRSARVGQAATRPLNALGARVSDKPPRGRSMLVDDDAAYVLAGQQVLVTLVDLIQGVGPGDDLIELEIAGLVQAKDLGDVGGRVAVTEQAALHGLAEQRQDGPGQLDGRLQQLVEPGQHDDSVLADRVEPRPHDLGGHEVDGEDGRVGALAPGHLGNGLLRLRRGGERVRRAEFHGLLALVLQRVDGDDVLRAGVTGALHGVDPDAADAVDRDRVARRDLGRVNGRTPAGGHAAADQYGLVQRQVVVDLDRRVLMDHPVLAEGAEDAHGAVLAARTGEREMLAGQVSLPGSSRPSRRSTGARWRSSGRCRSSG